MSVRNIIEIDQEKCNGCGQCVTACHEGAIQMIDGKAKLVSDIYCDGLGDCLQPCPTGAITLVRRQAEEYDAEAVEKRKNTRSCPGQMSKSLQQTGVSTENNPVTAAEIKSELMNWPVQLKLVPTNAPYFKNADILIAADCTAVAIPDFHQRYLKNKPVIITCPKLDAADPQIDKLAEIIRNSRPASLTILRMEVPCCGGLVQIVTAAVQRSQVEVAVNTIVIDFYGRVA